MISLIEHIEYLASTHDCVIIPGLGAIIAQYNHSYYDDKIGAFRAPTRSLSFNETIITNDGLLANSIARREGKSYEKSLALIGEEVSSIKTQLMQGNEIPIGRIGRMSLNTENSIIFEPFKSQHFKNDYFALKSFSMPLLSERIALTKTVEEKQNVSPQKDILYLPISRGFFKIAASIILLISLGFLLSTPIIVDDKQEMASFAPTVKRPVAEAIDYSKMELFITIPVDENSLETEINTSLTENIVSEPKADDIIKTPTQKAPVKEIKQKEETKSTPRIQLQSNESDEYFLIVSSLETLPLAERHITRSNDSSMRIMQFGGKYRIYVASSNSKSELSKLAQSSTIKSRYPGAWVCRK